jgi:hypothetical protein
LIEEIEQSESAEPTNGSEQNLESLRNRKAEVES